MPDTDILSDSETAKDDAETKAETKVEAKAEDTKTESNPPPAKPVAKVDDLKITEDAVDLDALDVDGLLKKSGVTREDVAAKFLETGKLDPAHAAAFKKIGVPRAIAEHMLSLELEKAKFQHARIADFQKEAEQIAGGAEQLGTLRAWAKTNMPKSKLDALNLALEKDPSTYPDMIATIQRHYNASNKTSVNTPGRAAAGDSIPSDKELSNLHNLARAGNAEAIKKLGKVPLARSSALL